VALCLRLAVGAFALAQLRHVSPIEVCLFTHYERFTTLVLFGHLSLQDFSSFTTSPFCGEVCLSFFGNYQLHGSS
jgi:hypothetical protein